MNNKTKKKGFTLVELLAAVVLLGLLITGVVVGISKVVKKSRQNYYIKQQELVTQAGREYFNDNRNMLPTVIDAEKCVKLSTLIGNKYIDKVVDYDNNGCSLEDSKVCATKISRTKYSYRTALSCPDDNSTIINYNTPTIEFSGDSSPGKNKLPSVSFRIYYADTSDESKNPALSQYKYYIYKKGTDGESDSKYSYTSQQISGEKKDITIDAELVKQIKSSGTYYIRVIAYNKYGDVKATSNEMKIEFGLDCEKDVILITNSYENSPTDNKWANKNLAATIKIGDKVENVQIVVKKNNTEIYNETSTKKGEISFPLSDDGVYEYTATAKDEFGEECSVKTYYRIDKTAPICQVTSDKTTWTNDKQTLTATCSDSGSGCIEAQRTKTFSEDKDEEYVFDAIYDKAGNVGYCNPVRVMVDKQPPTCKITSSGTKGTNNWYTSNVNISFSEKNDNHTAENEIKYVITESSTTPTTFNNQNVQLTTDTKGKTYYGYVKDLAGNVSECTSTIDVKKDSTKPECNINTSGTKTDGVYSSNVTVTIDPEDSISGISSKGLTTDDYELDSFQYNNKTSLTQSNDTEGTTYFAYIKNGAGLTQKCSTTVVVRKIYKITFNLSGGAAWTTTTCPSPLTLSSAVCSKNVRIQSTYETLPTPTRTGYTFGGWYDSNSGGNKIESATKKTTSGDQTLYAHWNACAYTVKFNANGGTGTMNDESFTYDTEKALTSNSFTKDGYTFVGWSTTTNGTVEYTDGKKVKNLTSTCNGTVNLYAVWSLKTYTVDYDTAGGTPVPDSQTKNHGTNLTLTSTVPTKTDEPKVFSGWKATDGTIYNKSATYSKNENTTMTAQYCRSCAPTGGASCSLTATNGTCTYTTSCPAGYSISNNGNYNVSCTACSYTVKFNANGGTGTMDDESFTYGTEKALTSNSFTYASHTFQGWSTSEGGTVEYTNGKKVKNLTTTCNGTVNLYAVWDTNSYSVKYDANGGSGAPAPQTKTYGVNLTLSNTLPTFSAHTFAGWKATDNTMYSPGGTYSKNAGTTMTAQWCNNCAPTGGASCTLTATNGICSYSTSCPAGYTISNSGKYNPSCTACTYTVKFNANGGTGTMSNETFTYGTEKALTSNSFTRTGYAFSGWATSASGAKVYANGEKVKNLTTTCDGTVNLYAVWVEDSAPTCSITVSSGTLGENDYYTTDVGIKMTTSNASSYGLTTTNSATYNSTTTATLSTDTEGTTYYGYVQSTNGKTATCSKTIKRMAKTPSCSIAATGTTGDNSWFTGNVTLTLTTTNADSYGFTDSSSATYSSTSKTINHTTNTTSKKYYGYVKTLAGKTASCSKTIKKSEAPTCSFAIKSGTKGNNDWYKTNVGLGITVSNASTSGLATNPYSISKTTTKNYTTTSSITQSDTSEITYSAYVKNAAGQETLCGTQKVKVDTIAPVIVVNSTRCITTGHGGSSGVEEINSSGSAGSSRDSQNCLTDTAQTGTLSSSGTSVITSANLYDTTWNEAGTSYTYTTSDANSVTTTWAYNTSGTVTSLNSLGNPNTRTNNPDTVTLTASGRRVGQIVSTDAAGNSSSVKVFVNISPTYKVTLNANGGSWSSSSCSGTDVTYSSSTCKKEVTYKYTYGSLPTPIRTDYKFLGWYTTAGSEGATKITSSKIYDSAENTTIYAKWSKNETDCNPYNPSWNSTNGDITITANTSLALYYRRAGKDSTFTYLATANSKSTSGLKHYNYVYRAGSTTEYYCNSKYDANKPYTPMITDVKKKSSNSSIIGYSCVITTSGVLAQVIDCDAKTTSPTTCTVDVSCKYNDTNTCQITIWSQMPDQGTTNESGQSGIYRRYYKRYYYNNDGSLKETCEYWDAPGGDPSKNCSDYYGKAETYTIDNAGNRSSTQTAIFNYHWHD